VSKKQQILTIEPNQTKTESFEFSEFECKYCNGRGGFIDDSNATYFNDPDWIVCKICDGAKKLTAKVTIDWLPNEN